MGQTYENNKQSSKARKYFDNIAKESIETDPDGLCLLASETAYQLGNNRREQNMLVMAFCHRWQFEKSCQVTEVCYKHIETPILELLKTICPAPKPKHHEISGLEIGVSV